MAYDKKELSNRIKHGFRVSIPEEIVEDSFPHIDRPSAKEMEIAIDASLNNLPTPHDIEAKLSRKPTWEMLNGFCTKRGLSWEKDTTNRLYLFKIKRFYSSE